MPKLVENQKRNYITEQKLNIILEYHLRVFRYVNRKHIYQNILNNVHFIYNNIEKRDVIVKININKFLKLLRKYRYVNIHSSYSISIQT